MLDVVSSLYVREYSYNSYKYIGIKSDMSHRFVVLCADIVMQSIYISLSLDVLARNLPLKAAFGAVDINCLRTTMSHVGCKTLRNNGGTSAATRITKRGSDYFVQGYSRRCS